MLKFRPRLHCQTIPQNEHTSFEQWSFLFILIKEFAQNFSELEISDNNVRCKESNHVYSIKSEIEIPAQIKICQIMNWNKIRIKKIKITGVPQNIVELNNQN